MLVQPWSPPLPPLAFQDSWQLRKHGMTNRSHIAPAALDRAYRRCAVEHCNLHRSIRVEPVHKSMADLIRLHFDHFLNRILKDCEVRWISSLMILIILIHVAGAGISGLQLSPSARWTMARLAGRFRRIVGCRAQGRSSLDGWWAQSSNLECQTLGHSHFS